MDASKNFSLLELGLVVVCYAICVRLICQGFDNSTFTNLTTATRGDHMFKLGLQCSQLCNALIYRFKMGCGDGRHGLAGLIRMVSQFEQLTDSLLREP